MDFSQRVASLPRLGVGVSTEYGAGDTAGSLDLGRLLAEHGDRVGFLELGVELAKGLDPHARHWLATGRPVTWHFLDVNLDEPEDFDPAWEDALRSGVAEVDPAWVCGDAGLWHFGPRERGTMLLLPPVLTARAADAMAPGLRRLRALTGKEALPENPPGAAFVGDLHLLSFFARLCEAADTGMVLDCAHLAIYQKMLGHAALDGFADFDLDRVVELHVAGGVVRDHQGLVWIEDDHSPAILPETWAIVDHLLAHGRNVRAIVYECERNPVDAVLPALDRLAGRV